MAKQQTVAGYNYRNKAPYVLRHIGKLCLSRIPFSKLIGLDDSGAHPQEGVEVMGHLPCKEACRMSLR